MNTTSAANSAANSGTSVNSRAAANSGAEVNSRAAANAAAANSGTEVNSGTAANAAANSGALKNNNRFITVKTRSKRAITGANSRRTKNIPIQIKTSNPYAALAISDNDNN
jgi:hypothetical protein